MWIDDLPMWGYLGDIEGDELFLTRSIRKSQVFLYTHTHFSIGFNGDQIVSVNVTTDPTKKVDIIDTSAEMEVIFSYSVQWVPERSEERRVGKECVSKFRSRWSRYH